MIYDRLSVYNQVYAEGYQFVRVFVAVPKTRDAWTNDHHNTPTKYHMITAPLRPDKKFTKYKLIED